MKDTKTPFILRPLALTLFLAAVLVVCALAFRAGEDLKASETAARSEITSLQESRAYYQGHIAAKPVIRNGQIDLPPLPETPEVTDQAYAVQEMAYLSEEEVVPAVLSQDVPREIYPPITSKLNSGSNPKIAIIIDDMGMDKRHTREALTLPVPVTFAWLPYATGIQELVDQAKAAGHENIVHVPMEPESKTIDAGPTVLKTDMSSEELHVMLDKNLTALKGYTGFNNHMGSRLTQDMASMQIVMAVAKERGLLFVDSKTSPNSIAATVAASFGVPYAVRDVFLDHYEDRASVGAALAKVEEVARRQGMAIAIGHPKDNTLAALNAWIPGLAEKGFDVVAVSDVVIVVETAAGESAPQAAIQTDADASVRLLQQPVLGPSPY